MLEKGENQEYIVVEVWEKEEKMVIINYFNPWKRLELDHSFIHRLPLIQVSGSRGISTSFMSGHWRYQCQGQCHCGRAQAGFRTSDLHY